MDRYTAMRVFVRVAELQSFTRAAESLNLPKATVTGAVQELESRVDARLLHRTTRTVQLTTDGAAFLDRCKDMLNDLEEAETMFRGGAKIQGKIRVDMTARMAREFFIPLLPRFLESHPDIEIELSCNDRRVDLIREGIDCAIRGANFTDAGLAEREIATMELLNVCTPGYLKKYGTPKTLEDLKQHRLVHYVQNFGGRPEGFEYFDGQKYREIKMAAIVTVNHVDAYRAACLAGLGICQNPREGFVDELKNGEVVEVLPKFRAAPLKLKLVYPQRRLLAKRVRVFMDWLEPQLRSYLK